jgi:hypothetical protein
LQIFSKYQARRGIAATLEKLAGIESLYTDPVHAVRMLGAAEKLRLAIASPVEGTDRAYYKLVVDGLRSQMDEQTYKNAWLEGSLMPLDEIIFDEMIESIFLQA